MDGSQGLGRSFFTRIGVACAIAYSAISIRSGVGVNNGRCHAGKCLVVWSLRVGGRTRLHTATGRVGVCLPFGEEIETQLLSVMTNKIKQMGRER